MTLVSLMTSRIGRDRTMSCAEVISASIKSYNCSSEDCVPAEDLIKLSSSKYLSRLLHCFSLTYSALQNVCLPSRLNISTYQLHCGISFDRVFPTNALENMQICEFQDAIELYKSFCCLVKQNMLGWVGHATVNCMFMNSSY